MICPARIARCTSATVASSRWNGVVSKISSDGKRYTFHLNPAATFSDGSAVLGLLTHDRQESGKLALQMDRTFGALFNTEAHLDVVFLDDEADARIRKSFSPFYDRRARYH